MAELVKEDYITVEEEIPPFELPLMELIAAGGLLAGGFVTYKVWKDRIIRAKCKQSTEHIGQPEVELRAGAELEDVQFESLDIQIEIRGGLEDRDMNKGA